jgi:hypothetical protein
MAEKAYRAFPHVEYTERSSEFIERFLLTTEKKGSYWDGDEKELAAVKKEIKDYYLRAQDYKCAYCRQRMEVNHNGMWDTEHVINKDEYPAFMFEPRNLCVCCKDCNTIKGKKNILKNKNRITYPSVASDYTFCHPHYHNYDHHVKVIKEAMFYLPITDEGRNMIEICGLLRFVYKFAGYECVESNVPALLIRLGNELQESKNPHEQIALMTIVKELMSNNIKKLAGNLVKEYE